MTAGQEALVEAMRLEQARIYGQLDQEAREHQEARRAVEQLAPVVHIRSGRRRSA